MGQVQTNNTTVQISRETSLGVLAVSPSWKAIEPNDIGKADAETPTVARSPISKLRQRRKGTIVDLNASVEFSCDATLDSFDDFIESAFLADATNNDLRFRAANAGATGYTVAALTAAQAGKLLYTSGGPITLFHTAGYAIAANNSPQTVKPLNGAMSTSDTILLVSGLSSETAPTNAEVEVCGVRCEAGDLALAISGNIGTLTSGNNSSSNPIDFTDLGLTAGQKIHIGGLTDTNRFGSNGAATTNNAYGSARIRTISAGTITLDKLDATLLASDGTDDGNAGTLVAVDLLFGRFIRNVSSDHASYNQISHHVEVSFPNIYETEPPTPVANPDGFGYVPGAVTDEFTINLGLADKATLDLKMLATDSQPLVNNASRKANASSARSPLFTGAINTASDAVRLRIDDVDDTGLTTDFKDLTVSFKNNLSAEKVLGLLGTRYLNVGNFEVSASTEAIFNSATVADRIRNNTTATMDWMSRADDGAIAIDLPSLTIGSSGKSFPVGQSVTINLEIETFVDELFQTSASASLFPVYPAAA